MTETAVRRGRAILFGTAIAIACVSGLPLVAGAVGVDSAVGSCSAVGSNSSEICFTSTATAIPKGAPQTGAGGASHSTDGNLIAGGGLALAGAVCAAGLAVRRRPARATSE